LDTSAAGAPLCALETAANALTAGLCGGSGFGRYGSAFRTAMFHV